MKNLEEKYKNNQLSLDELLELRDKVNSMNDEILEETMCESWMNDDIDISNISSERMNRIKKEVDRTIGKKRSAHSLIMKMTQIAAVILLPVFIILSFYLYRENNTLSAEEMLVSTAKRERANITLPDGTQVKLNAESSLSYTHDFGRELRQVNLEGEAYFEVTRNEDKPFVVHTKYLDIEVLGTSFNVYSYERENVMEMALISGRIKIQTCSEPSRVVYLKPNEKALFNKESGIITVEKTDNRFETAWLRGDLVFRSTTLSDVLAKLERRYGVNIHLNDSSLANDLFTGNFDSEYIVEVMDLLERHYDFTYDVRGDDIFIHP